MNVSETETLWWHGENRPHGRGEWIRAETETPIEQPEPNPDQTELPADPDQMPADPDDTPDKDDDGEEK